jgi:D-lyxose ketol-isomerase
MHEEETRRMKRSEINSLIGEAKSLFNAAGFKLPPFAFWSPEDWKRKGKEADEIRANALGWDVTDFGSGDFHRTGLLLFTIRNGNYHHPDQFPKPYAEKIMVVKENQVTPTHFHWKKREDIINRGGGELVLELWKATSEEKLSNEPFAVSIDGVRRECRPGEKVVLHPGESITLEPYVYHKFYGALGKGTVVVGEVSAVNDDTADNRFLDAKGRFPRIDEDEPPVHLLCNEYPGPGGNGR